MMTRYIAKVGLSRKDYSRICEAGEECPADVVEAAPWLLKQGLVVAEDVKVEEKGRRHDKNAR